MWSMKREGKSSMTSSNAVKVISRFSTFYCARIWHRSPQRLLLSGCPCVNDYKLTQIQSLLFLCHPPEATFLFHYSLFELLPLVSFLVQTGHCYSSHIICLHSDPFSTLTLWANSLIFGLLYNRAMSFFCSGFIGPDWKESLLVSK